MRNRPKIIFTHSSHFLWPSTKKKRKKENKSIHKAATPPPLPFSRLSACLASLLPPSRQQQIGFVAPSIFILILSAEYGSIYCENVKETEKSSCPAPCHSHSFAALLAVPVLDTVTFLGVAFAVVFIVVVAAPPPPANLHTLDA